MQNVKKIIFFVFIFCFSFQSENSFAQEQVELTSDGGLEWDSSAQTITALDKALVVRGDTRLGADKIIASYNQNAKTNENEIYFVIAKGNVIVTTPEQIVYADSAEYEIKKSVIILKGNPVKLVAGQEEMTAKRLELWQKQDLAVAKNNVTATKGERRLEADVVRAYFLKKNDKTQVDRFEAENNVVITNDKETVQGDFGVYFIEKETASLQGNVKISQGKNAIFGEVADVNMKTGVSRLQTLSKKGKAKGRVRGVFVPETQKNKPANTSKKGK